MNRGGDLVVKSDHIKAFILATPMVKLPFASPAFSLKFAAFHAFPFTTSNVLWLPQNPLFNFALKRLESWPAPLWSSFICKKGAAPRVVVKVSLQRRVRAAYWLSLEKYGYGKDGRVLSGREVTEGIHGNKTVKTDLFGTAQFMVEAVCLKMKFEELRQQMDSAVYTMIYRQRFKGQQHNAKFVHPGNGINGKPATRPSRPPYQSTTRDAPLRTWDFKA